jgi:hypothetical protein
MSSMSERIKAMRQDAKSKETKLFQGKTRSGNLSVTDLEEGKTVIRIVKHPNDEVPFMPFRSTWLEVEEGIDKLSRYHLENLVKEKKLEKVLKIKDIKDVKDDELRDMLIDELGKGFSKNVKKRVFISKIHGNPDLPDLIEEHIRFAQQFAKNNGDSDFEKKVNGFIRGYKDSKGNWNRGIMPDTSFVCYIYNWDNPDELKRFEIWGKHMDEIEKLYAAFDEEDQPITIDPFSDPKEGIGIVFEKFKNEKGKFDFDIYEKKNTSRTGTFKDFVKQFELTDKQVEEIESKESLTETFMNVYSKRDFELALNGLQLFDQEKEIGVFENDDFLSIVEDIATHYENETEQVPTKKEKPKEIEVRISRGVQRNEPVSEKEVKKEEKKFQKVLEKAKLPEPDIKPDTSSDYGDTIDELKQFIKEQGLDVAVSRRDGFDEIVEKIDAALAELEKVDDSDDQESDDSEQNYVPEEGEDEENDPLFGKKELEQKPAMDLTSLRDRLKSKIGK